MTRPAMLLLAAVVALARRLRSSSTASRRSSGFSIRRIDSEHELRRTILVAIYALLLFLPVFLFGFGAALAARLDPLRRS